MTRPYAIIGSALATGVINVLVAVVLIVSLTPEVAQTQYNSAAPLYRLSPIPAGADLGRS
jgi:amino acid transporter